MVLKNNKNISAVKCEPEIANCEPQITKCEQNDEDLLISIVLKYCLISRTAREICDKLGNLSKRYVANNN